MHTVAKLNLEQETTMTDDRMALIELIEKGADSDLVPLSASCWPLPQTG